MSIQFSRQRPPRVLIPANINHLGAQNLLIPTEYKPSTGRIRRTLKPQVIEHDTYYEDFNACKPTPLHPSYELEPQASHIIQGKAFMTQQFPIIY